jgi:hypothetical protein
MKHLLIATLALLALPVAAGTIAVQWDPATHPTLTGYRVYSGTSSGVYAYTQVSTNTQAVVPVPDCVEFWIAVKAEATTTDPEDDDGVMESVNFSNEIFGWAAPQIASRHVIKTNKVVPFELRGLNFRPGAELEVTGAMVTDVVVVDCQTITATLDPRNAPAGDAMVTVMNPDSTFGASNAVTFYQGPTPPPDVTNLRK